MPSALNGAPLSLSATPTALVSEYSRAFARVGSGWGAKLTTAMVAVQASSDRDPGSVVRVRLASEDEAREIRSSVVVVVVVVVGCAGRVVGAGQIREIGEGGPRGGDVEGAGGVGQVEQLFSEVPVVLVACLGADAVREG